MTNPERVILSPRNTAKPPTDAHCLDEHFIRARHAIPPLAHADDASCRCRATEPVLRVASSEKFMSGGQATVFGNVLEEFHFDIVT